MGKQVAARLKKEELVLPVIRGFKRLRLLMTDKDSVKAMKCFDIDWCGSYEVTSNGFALAKAMYIENFIQR